MKILSSKIKLRLGLWVVIGLAFLFFVFQAIVPFGRLTGEYHPLGFNFWGGQGIVGPLGPSDRLVKSNYGFTLVQSPAYFSIYSPREFKQAKLTVTYRNLDPDNQPNLEAGVLVDKNLWQFNSQGLENLTVEKLMRSWPKKDLGAEFELTNPDSNLKLKSSWPQVAVYQSSYRYPLSALPQDEVKELTWPKLRGDQQISVAINGAPLKFEFSFSDLNQNNQVGGDPISILIYNSNNELIASHDLPDSGSDLANGLITDRGSWQLYRADLPSGIYNIEIKANDDIITSLKMANQHAVLRNKAWLFAPTKFWTNSSALRYQTKNPDSLGKISWAGQEQELAVAYQNYKATSSTSGIKAGQIAAGDILLTTEGDIAFSSDAFFLNQAPQLNADTNYTNLDLIKASYQAPIDLGNGFRQATIELDLNSAWREEGRYKFMLSAPDLTKGVEIKNIRVELTGQSLGGKLVKMLQL